MSWSPVARSKSAVRSLIRTLGFDLVRLTPAAHPAVRRARLIAHAGIDVVFDIGANTGQYASELRRLGYHGRIVSCEPLSEPFKELARAASGVPGWEVVNIAIGESSSRREMFVSQNLASSSFLPMLPIHERSAPQARHLRREEVSMEPLAALFEQRLCGATRPMVKLDVQGYEDRILDTAIRDERIRAWQLEMSLVPLYAGEAPMRSLMEKMWGHGLTLVNLEPGFSDPDTGRLLQVDGLFIREDGSHQTDQ